MKLPPGNRLDGVSQLIDLFYARGGRLDIDTVWNLDPHHVYVDGDGVWFSTDSGDTWSNRPLNLAGLIRECHKCDLKLGQWK